MMDLFELNNRIKEMSDEELNDFYDALRKRQRDKVTGEVIVKKKKDSIDSLNKDQMLALLEALSK